MRFRLPEIHHDRAGFEALAHFHAQVKECFFEEIKIDLGETRWFDGDMCAVLGAVLYGLGRNLNVVELVNIPTQVEKILARNGFLSHYGQGGIPDYSDTTIPYQRCDVEDDRYFSDYIVNEFINRPELPAISVPLRKKLHENIFEIFNNAVLHSRTELGIFSCGQFFQERRRLDFTVTDLGVGMRQNIKDHLGRDLPPEKAISWATEGQNTTRLGEVPGGLGLKLLNEFIDFNQGSIQIVSDAGYWMRQNRRTTVFRLKNSFPGTVVSVEINTADTNIYSLSSEVDPEDVF